ncbi:MAG: alpha/beta fold hydrolase [Acidobacteriaceae bacterium]
MTTETAMERYLAALRTQLGPLTLSEREEILREIEAHIRDAAEEPGNSVDAALARLGAPEKLAAEYRDGLLIRQASRSFSPVRLLRGALRLATKGLFGTLVFFFAVIGYAVGGGFIVTAFLKVFLPGNTGLWIGGSRVVSSGTIFPAPVPPAHEVLGYWYIPIALTIGALLLIATTWAIRLCLRTSKFCQAKLGTTGHRIAVPVVMLAVMAALGARTAWPQTSLPGDWSGTLTVSGQQLHLALHLTPGENGAFQAKLDSIDQGAMGIPCSEVSVQGEAFSFAVPAIGGHYAGRIGADGKSIAGTWSQGPLSLPLNWTRGGGYKLDRPQEPKPPFPYQVKTVTIPNPAAHVSLAGTLTEPEGNGPFPAVVLVGGSGPIDRDETVFGHKPFLVLADFLTRHGIAVLRYDKRGVAGSTGNYKNATTRDFADDALAALEFLKAQPNIDAKHLGLIGHSEGGMIAPMVAVESHDISFVVLMAGPGVPGDVLLPQQVYRGDLAEGASADQAGHDAMEEAADLRLLERFPDADQAIAAMQARAGSDGEKQQLAAQRDRLTSPWFRFFASYDPYPTLTKVSCPVLALDGSKDFQVPADLNLPFIRTAISWNPRSEVVEVEGANHLFQDASTGAESEYTKIPETMSPKVLDLINGWIHQQM